MSTSKKKARQRANRRYQSRPSSAVSSREGKRAEFTGQRGRNRHLWAGLAVVALLAVAVVVVVGLSNKKEGTAVAAAPVTAGNVTIPVSEVSDGATHFYSADVGGTTVKYFVMKATDGTLRAAFDACEVCFQFKKGYHQQGDAVQCNNCGRVFQSNQISVQRGGCNPGPIHPKIKNGTLTITPEQLQEGVRYF